MVFSRRLMSSLCSVMLKLLLSSSPLVASSMSSAVPKACSKLKMLGEEGQMLAYYWSIGLGFILVAFFFFSKSNHISFSLINLIRLRKKLQKQGLKGPPPLLLRGNESDLQKIVAASRPLDGDGVISHDFVSNLFPYFHQWTKEYGKVYIYTLKQKQHLYVNSPELVKEMSQNMSTDLGRPTNLINQLFPLFGNGIAMANRLLWTHQKKILAPEFYMEKIKGMVRLMREASDSLVEKWEHTIVDGGGRRVEMRVDEDLRNFSADVIAKACFGSSYVKGNNIFSKLRALHHILSSNGQFIVKNYRKFGRSDREREIKRLEKEVNDLIWDTVQERRQEENTNDLMQSLLQSTNYDGTDKKGLIIDNCKNIYFAGHESTAVSAAWCLVLLASYPNWQTRLRQELLQEDQPLTLDALNRMKWLNMFVQEALRLYPPAAFVTREALQDVRLGDLMVPKGVQVWSLIPALHHDSELWGVDSLDFKPERFANGVANACKIPQAYIPFGIGPRTCLGKNFALIELKIVLSHIISAFTFSLSEKYRHSPTYTMVIEPAHGVYLLMDKIAH